MQFSELPDINQLLEENESDDEAFEERGKVFSQQYLHMLGKGDEKVKRTQFWFGLA